MESTLTAKQRKFVECYAGNATEAAIAAGYSKKTARSQGNRMLTNVDIQKAIFERGENQLKNTIADREQRQAFWTSTMNDSGLPMRDRLKASELLARSEGDFIDRVDHSRTDGSAPVSHVMVVPLAESMEEWEELAAKSQAKLKAEVKQ